MTEMIGKLPEWAEGITTPEEVDNIIAYNHLHIRDAFPEAAGIIWKGSQTMVPGENEIHRIQFTFRKPGDYTLHCFTCNGQCPAAVAVLMQVWNTEIKGKWQTQEGYCPVCKQKYGPGHSHNGKFNEAKDGLAGSLSNLRENIRKDSE